MQFLKNGPDIPERLLQAHEDGQVVFFCGAGVSYPARLPGFDNNRAALLRAWCTTKAACGTASVILNYWRREEREAVPITHCHHHWTALILIPEQGETVAGE